MNARVLVVLAGCAAHPAIPLDHTCRDALLGFASGDPAKFSPLPATCTITDANAALHSLGPGAGSRIGERERPFDYFASAAVPRIRVWTEDGRILLVDADWPKTPLSTYEQVLGPPDQHLAYEEYGTRVLGKQLVWLSRGVVVIPGGPMVASRIGVFPPQSLDEFNHTTLLEGQDNRDEIRD